MPSVFTKVALPRLPLPSTETVTAMPVLCRTDRTGQGNQWKIRIARRARCTRNSTTIGSTPPRITFHEVPGQVMAQIFDDPMKSPLLEAFSKMPASISEADQDRTRAARPLGSRFDIRQFHDIVLGQGAVAMDLLEQQVNAWIQSALK